MPISLATNVESLVQTAAQAADQIAAMAADRDADRSLPTTELDLLHQTGLTTATLPEDLGGDGLGAPDARHALYRVLAQIGRGSLPVGRLYEGHVNALDLVMAYGTDRQRARAADDAHAGHLFGVWNTEGADGVTLVPSVEGASMRGAKVFCSGAGHVSRAFANGRWQAPGAPQDGAWQMALVPLDGRQDRAVPDSWAAEGMRASVSGRVSFEGIALDAEALVGVPDAYTTEPDFTGGAVRFAAVHLGGAEALVAAAADHLQQSGRDTDPHQRRRMGEAAIALETGALWLLGAARLWEARAEPDAIVAYAQMTRTAIERVCLDVMERVDRCVGARGLLPPSPIERIGRDLRLYLRQPAPDATLDAAGAAALLIPPPARGSAPHARA